MYYLQELLLLRRYRELECVMDCHELRSDALHSDRRFNEHRRKIFNPIEESSLLYIFSYSLTRMVNQIAFLEVSQIVVVGSHSRLNQRKIGRFIQQSEV